MTNEQAARIIALYSSMPGAPMPSKEDGSYMWGDVDGNEHWQFCREIILTTDRMITNAIEMHLYSRHLRPQFPMLRYLVCVLFGPAWRGHMENQYHYKKCKRCGRAKTSVESWKCSIGDGHCPTRGTCKKFGGCYGHFSLIASRYRD